MANNGSELLEYSDENEVPFQTGTSLGQGAFATVYKAKEKLASEYAFAAKVFGLPNNDIQQELQKAAILREAKLIKKARHRHTISLITTFVYDDKIHIIMEPLADLNLEKYLYRTTREKDQGIRQQRQNQLLCWFGCLISGLAYLHSQDIRHRDIKPQNILIHGGRILLADFGIATDDPGRTVQTGTSTIGTEVYKAPEWKRIGSGNYLRPGRSGDVYSLGAVFLDMLLIHSGQTLRMVCDERGVHLQYRDHADNWISDLQRMPIHNVSWHQTILFLCQKMLQKDPAARPSADELRLFWSYQPFEVVPATHCDCQAEKPYQLYYIQGAEEVLEHAVKYGHKLVLDLMIKRGFDINHPNCLKAACITGSSSIMELLLRGGADVNLKDPETGRTPLSWAAEKGETAIVGMLLHNGAGVQDTDGNNRTALSWAAQKGHREVVELLLQNGAMVQEMDESGRTALSWAAQNGHKGVVELLLGKGAKSRIIDESGRTTLSWAAQNGHREVLELLFEKGAKIEGTDQNGRAALSWAAQNGHRAVVELLLEKGAKIDGMDESGRTALSWAAQNGHGAVVQLLLKQGANVTTADGAGRTPIGWANENSHSHVVQILEQPRRNQVDESTSLRKSGGQKCLDPVAINGYERIQVMFFRGSYELPNFDKRLPLWSALEKGDKAAATLLLDKEANVEERNIFGQSPLSWAAENGKDTAVDVLLKRGAEIEHRSSNGQTPLSWAATYGHVSTMQLLLDRNAYKESRSNNGQTPLSWAAAYGQDSAVALLLEHGANIESRSNSGQTPLSWAAMYGQRDTVQLLLNRGASIDSQSNNSQTPLLWALDKGHDTVASLLLERGASLEADKILSQNFLLQTVKSLLGGDHDTDVANTYGQSPLSWAAENGKDTAVDVLLKRGAEIEHQSSNGQTPLSWAATYGHVSTMQLLLDRNAYKESRSNNGQTPLSWAAAYGQDSAVALLLEHGANIESRSNSGQTPLSWAAMYGQRDTVQLLLNRGASIDSQSNNSQTPLLWALEKGQDATVELLRQGNIEEVRILG